MGVLPLMVFLGFIGGAVWAFMPAYFKSIGLVNETITTLLMNMIAPKIAGLLVFGYWHSPRETNMTPNFVQAARLPTFFGTRIHLGFVIGLVLLAVFWFVMKSTRWGLEMRTIGGNVQAARRNGIPVTAYMLIVFCISGGIAGLAGMAQVSGFYGLLIPNFSPGYGYMGFLISWLAGGDPLGILLMAFVVSIIMTGGNMLQVPMGIPYAVINLLLAFTLFVVLARPVTAKIAKRKKRMSFLSLLGVLSSAIFSGTSLLYATLGEVVNERAGIVNLGLEGVLLISAATGYGVTIMTGDPFIGVLAAMLAGGLVNMLFGYLVITRKANQLASGLAILFFGYGLSALDR